MKLKDKFILIITLAGLTLTGCLEMELKVQPNHAAVGSSFSATTEVVQTGNDGERAMLFAVNKPIGWTINSVTFSSPEQGNGTFSYLGNETDADLAGAGGIDVGWEDSVEAAHPSEEMMHWQMYLSDGVASSAASEENPDTFHVTVNYTVDNSEGTYGLKYWVSYDNNGEHESESGTANDGRSIVVYDPAVSSLVTFTVDDQSWLNEDIRIKGSMSGWSTFQAYDDGTNGDATAGDYIWTAQYAVITDGDYEWGAIDTDNGDGTSCEACDGTDGWGTWLIVGDNPAFNLEDDLLTLHGATDYVIEDVAGEEITKTVLFSVDMTEWLDEEGNEGMRAFSIANGDEVQVRGSFNGWGDCQECTMTRTPGTNFFSHAIEVTSLPDVEHEFAYYMHLSEASLSALAERFDAYDSEGNPAIVDWIGWETSPQYEGNRNFVLGEEDETNLVELPSESYYDAFPGSVVPEGTSIDVIFSIDMYGVEGFNASEDSVYLRTHDKWLNFSQGYSDGQDLNHYAAEAVGNGVYEFPVTLNGPVPWCIYYKWGWYDTSESTENDEAGGGLGGVPRIRYLHQSLNDNCEWPSSYRFPLDTEFYLDENDGQEAWDPEGICMVLMANDESENTALPSEYRISNNYPNPFNPTTEMEFSLPIESDISFSVYSLTGEEIYSFDRSSVPGGNYKITWNGKNRSGIAVPSGVYLYEFRAGNEFRQVKKMTLLK